MFHHFYSVSDVIIALDDDIDKIAGAWYDPFFTTRKGVYMIDLFARVRCMWDNFRGRRALDHLMNCQFHKVWHGKNLDDFHVFLVGQATSVGAFLIAWQLEEGGLVWFHYTIEHVPDAVCVVAKHNALQFPDNQENRDCPEEWKGLPVWRV